MLDSDNDHYTHSQSGYMDQQPLTSRLEQLPADVLLVAFSGKVGAGSEGNQHGSQMAAITNRAVDAFLPTALLIDFRGLDYRHGDWIGAFVLTASKRLGKGRVCVVATGDTGKALSTLWDLGLRQIVPLMDDLQEAYTCLGTPGPQN